MYIQCYIKGPGVKYGIQGALRNFQKMEEKQLWNSIIEILLTVFEIDTLFRKLFIVGASR